MNFELTEKQLQLQKTIREIVKTEVIPYSEEIDRTGNYPRKQLEAFTKLGITGMSIPKDYGGNLEDMVTYGMVVEEIARGCASCSCVVVIYSLGSTPILLAGTEEQKKKYLPLIASGKTGCSFALTETDAGSDAVGIETTAVKKGNKYVLNGKKIFIGNAPVSDIYSVFARTDPSQGSKGITAFIIEKGTPGFTQGDPVPKMGLNGQRTGELFFDNCEIPAENMLGKEGEGIKIAFNTLNEGRCAIAFQAVGIAQTAMEESIKWAQSRMQFGKPLIKNQAISFKIANMATKIQAARLLAYNAATQLDKGVNAIKDCSIAKYFATEMVNQVTYDAVQIFGGRGFLKGYTVERLYRDARALTLYEGTSEIQQIVISREVVNEYK